MMKAELNVGMRAQNPGKRLLSVMTNTLTKIDTIATMESALFTTLL